MSEFSLYGGPSLQTAKADPGVAARAANGDQGQVLGASVQKAEEAVQGSAEAFARISDFGEMQRQEVELRRIRDESDAKFPGCWLSRRARRRAFLRRTVPSGRGS